ncbi:MAG: EVE domain-containing protein, partial [Alcanivorax sediminis]|uniref:EVE domain-containing protein n=1 Tax=Alcanivorax sediminis TaxID=2663008 RepID=UPI003C6AF5CC
PEHPAYDDRSNPEAPRWFQVELQFVRQYPSPISLKQIKQNPAFDDMELVIRPRLSIQKVTDQQYQLIEALCQSMGVSA